MKWLVPLSELAGVTDHTGGVGRRYAAVLSEASSLGAEVTILLYPDSGVDASPEFPRGVDVIVDSRWSWVPSFVRPVFRALMFRKRIREIRPDVIFAPEWLGAAALAPASVPVVTNLVTGIELMTEIEGGAGVRGSWRRRLQSMIQGRLERRQLRRSARVIACSSAILRWYQRKMRMPKDVSVVRNCIDVARVKQASGAAELPAAWPREGRVVLHAGRVEVRKGAHISALAFNTLASSYPDLKLVFAGGMGYALPEWGPEGVSSLIDPSLRERVVFLGNVRSDSLFRAMAGAEVCIVPSLWEAFGNIALEVKASRAPLVVTSGSGFDDFCHDGRDCRVVPPESAGELAKVVDELIADRTQRMSLVEEAASQVDDYSASAVAVDLMLEVERPVHQPLRAV